MINVTKTFLPPFEEYTAMLKRAWDKGWITNNGELLLELEEMLKAYTGSKNFVLCSNGTIVLQMALKALNITKEVITTPFSYVATSTAITWEGCKPVFVDIKPDTFCIDADKIEEAITPDTQAILATHVYGFPCDIEKIESLAKKYQLKVIYDAAHAFGCVYKGKSLLNYGDISTCSFHATKVFQMVEGGCVIARDNEVANKLTLYRQFGHIGEDYYSMGINAKNSELHAAMGLCVLPRIDELIARRKSIFKLYDHLLSNKACRCFINDEFVYNYGYYPYVFESETQMLRVKQALLKNEVSTRRYFYPSINTLPYMPYRPCPVSESISERVLTLPLFHELAEADVERISVIINSNL